ncbi:MAG: hypothetical protein HY047_04335 [Acidobacteria bacterium]|nr:hypothetical protein [Acidobacteriota bacterium]
MRSSSRLAAIGVWLAAGVGYALLAGLVTWPLALHLRTRLLGDPGGDTGVYVWNLWIFRHELLRHAHAPFSTGHVFAYTGGADFALHNYAPIAGLLGAPLIGALGVVGAFNAVMLACMALTGLGTFGLARRLGLGAAAAWCAGALFVASPVLTARETAHFSLVIAAALPLFLWVLLRALDTKRLGDAALVGSVVAAASYSDAYYGIYCALMGAFIVTWRLVRVESRAPTTSSPWRARALDITGAIIIGAALLWRVLAGPTAEAVAGPVRIGMHTLYTPALLLVLIAAIRLWLTYRPVVTLNVPREHVRSLLPLGLTAVGVCLVLMLPELAGIAFRFARHRLSATEIYWRSSPRGLDALAYFVPNPNHPWFGDQTREWLMPPDRPDAFPEFVGSFSIVALGVIAAAVSLRLLPRVWVAFTAFFVALSLGPFVHIAGINTFAIGPWALLRYVPVIGMARSPSRFAIVAALGLSLLFAFAIEALSRHFATTRRAIVSAVAIALAVELLPAPRHLYSAAVPEVYRLAAVPRDAPGRLLDLPTGIRDGTSSLGNFSAATLYYQTKHRRALLGGYLSRVSRWRKRETLRSPVLRTFIMLSEGGTPSGALADEARRGRDAFLRRSCVKFVVVNKTKASALLRRFAVQTLKLSLVHEDTAYALYTPLEPPVCEPTSPDAPSRRPR